MNGMLHAIHTVFLKVNMSDLIQMVKIETYVALKPFLINALIHLCIILLLYRHIYLKSQTSKRGALKKTINGMAGLQ